MLEKLIPVKLSKQLLQKRLQARLNSRREQMQTRLLLLKMRRVLTAPTPRKPMMRQLQPIETMQLMLEKLKIRLLD